MSVFLSILFFFSPGILALLAVVLACPFYIRWLIAKAFGQYIREEGPESHQAKAGTPTSGGVVFLLAWLLVSLICGSVWLYLEWAGVATFGSLPFFSLLVVTMGLGALGFVDDWQKIAKRHNKGVTGYTKLAIQSGLGVLLGVTLLMTTNPTGAVNVFNLTEISLYWAYPIFTAFIVTGVSNAVNLTDGLDGLATSTMLVSTMAMFYALLTSSVLAFEQNVVLIIPILAMIGALIGFLCFNKKPAQIFMGDTGSLALGGFLATAAILLKLEAWLLLIGLVFVVETLSVMLQVLSFKTTGKRIFKMSPIHHHFELSGWSENKIVIVFSIVQLMACALALSLMGPAL